MNELDINTLRTEIAILQEDIKDPTNPGVCKFMIPVISNDATLVNNAINSKIISVHRLGKELNSIGNLELEVPIYITYFYKKKDLKAGTKFIVSFIGGNINDPHIIGLYGGK